MSNYFTRFNKTRMFNNQPNTDNFVYKKLGTDLIESYNVRGLFTTTGKYGEHAVIITDKEYVSLPNHLTQPVKEIMSDAEAVKMINAECVCFDIAWYKDGNGVERPTIEWGCR